MKKAGRLAALFLVLALVPAASRGEEAMRMQIRETLRHEFLHHLETRAGLYWKGTLVEEDRDRMLKYYMRHGAGDYHSRPRRP